MLYLVNKMGFHVLEFPKLPKELKKESDMLEEKIS